MKLTKPLVVLDLETTGIWIEKDRIIEIGMVKVTPDGKQEVYSTKVNPCMPIPAVVTELTGISDADVKDAPAFGSIAGKVLAFLEGADWAVLMWNVLTCLYWPGNFPMPGSNLITANRTVYDAQKDLSSA